MKQVARSLASADGLQRVDVLDHQDGLFSWEAVAYTVERPPGCEPIEYWNSIGLSGLFDSAAAAEGDARQTLSWLRAGAGEGP